MIKKTSHALAILLSLCTTYSYGQTTDTLHLTTIAGFNTHCLPNHIYDLAEIDSTLYKQIDTIVSDPALWVASKSNDVAIYEIGYINCVDCTRITYLLFVHSNQAILFKNNKDETAPTEELEKMQTQGFINAQSAAPMTAAIKRIVAKNKHLQKQAIRW